MDLAPLPIDPLMPRIVDTLTRERALVLEAPPGAGKTTRVPRALLDAWRGQDQPGEIVVLEPRRLAARLAAKRVADELGEPLGKSIGYQVRFEDVSSADTRVRFVTEAILTRRLVRDPLLNGVRAVLLDEFHERSLHADVALAWLRALKRDARPDLRIVVMSATLDAEPAARFLECPSIRSEGKSYEVTLEHEAKDDDRPLASKVTSAVRALLARGLDGHVLVFLPGAAEIRRAAESLEKLASEHSLLVVALHGDLPPQEQDRAIRASAQRKIILSTNVAESSVTIDGVVAVVDGGVARVASHDPWSGMPRLAVQKVSQASCIQRAGRAGRTRPGTCLRLYTKGDFERRPTHDVPEIGRADLTQLALELHAAGKTDLEWLDAPPKRAWETAVALLERLGAIADGRVTKLGERMLRFPVHPRAARLLAEGEARHVTADAAIVAALLTERDIRATTKASFSGGRAAGGGGHGGHDRATEPSDLLAMRDLFLEAEAARFSAGPMRASGLDAGATLAVDRARKQLERLTRSGAPAGRGGRDEGARAVATDVDAEVMTCILAGYPDRVARRLRAGGSALALAGGGSAELAAESVVRHAEFMVAAEAEERTGGGPGRPGGIVVRTASAIEPEWLIDLYPDRITESRDVVVHKTSGRVEAVSRLLYDGLVLSESPAANVTDEELGRALADAALARGAHRFAPEGALERFVARARFAHEVDASLPLVDDDLVTRALRAMCAGHRSLAELDGFSLVDVLEAEIGHDVVRRIHALAPDRITLARGRNVKVEYEADKPPHIASRLQDFFGMKETPKVGGGKVPVVVHLLAPNQRAVQVTSDLEGFWDRHYPQIRKELARRYPRHAWPENPLS